MNLNPPVAANLQVQMRAKTGRNVVPAEAGTHGKYMHRRCFLLTWIPTFAGMTLAEQPRDLG
jgi:hypothetical protein